MTTSANRDLLALCALRDDGESIDWTLIAREAARAQSVDGLLAGEIAERSAAADRARARLPRLLKYLPDAYIRVEDELELAAGVDARLVTVLDDGYPRNLRLISNLPPFLFLLGGKITSDDLRSVAVVGTRKPSPAGLRRASNLAKALVEQSVTVVSGMAAGIDTAAHRATLDADGRTVAVMGTGVTRCFPKENEHLMAEIVDRGVIVSQFWPSTPPATWTFPRRNAVMSGIAQGTAVIEANTTSGAKMQARLAIEHGKRVFLMRSLVTDQAWARRYVDTRGAIEVDNIEDVVKWLATPSRIREVTDQRQLTLDLA